MTPDDGGVIWKWSDDCEAAFGNAAERTPGGYAGISYYNRYRPFFWTRDSGAVYLDWIVPSLRDRDLPITRVVQRPDSYVVILSELTTTTYCHRVFRVELPRDLSRCRSPADLDGDWDVDQTDFGLWQRDPSVMPAEEFKRAMTGPRE